MSEAIKKGRVYRFKIFYHDGTIDFVVCKDLALLGCMILEFWDSIDLVRQIGK